MQLPIASSFTTVLLNVTLPANLTCKHCVFQWKYRTGNSWGSFNGKSGLGFGRENEEFYGCSDIAIVKKNSTDRDPKLVSQPMPTGVSGVAVVQRRCVPAVTFSQSFDIGSVMEQYCQTVCSSDCASDNVTGNTALYQSCKQTCAKLCTCQWRSSRHDVATRLSCTSMNRFCVYCFLVYILRNKEVSYGVSGCRCIDLFILFYTLIK